MNIFYSNKRGQLKTSYKAPNVNANLDVDSAGGPAVRGAAVVGYAIFSQIPVHYKIYENVFVTTLFCTNSVDTKDGSQVTRWALISVNLNL